MLHLIVGQVIAIESDVPEKEEKGSRSAEAVANEIVVEDAVDEEHPGQGEIDVLPGQSTGIARRERLAQVNLQSQKDPLLGDFKGIAAQRSQTILHRVEGGG